MRNNLFVLSIFAALIMVSCVSTPHPAVLDSPKTETPSPVKTPTETPSPIPFADLEGTLFFDKNGNGLKDETEPSVVGFGVCTKAQEICVNSDAEGNFKIEKIALPDVEIPLRFIDPNKDTPSLAFRYVNIWKGEAVLPPYVYNNINVREQRLNDTSTKLLSEGIVIKAGEKVNIGLMQGIVTLPLNADGLVLQRKVESEKLKLSEFFLAV